jgi:hypothetical protein
LTAVRGLFLNAFDSPHAELQLRSQRSRGKKSTTPKLSIANAPATVYSAPAARVCEMPNKRILLLEPEYKNKYPPLGLMKIAQYHGPNGKHDRVTFAKGRASDLLMHPWDRIYITTLFSFEFQKIAETIDFALAAVQGESQRIFVGGIAASLMHSRFLAEPQWRGISFADSSTNRPPVPSN